MYSWSWLLSWLHSYLDAASCTPQSCCTQCLAGSATCGHGEGLEMVGIRTGLGRVKLGAEMGFRPRSWDENCDVYFTNVYWIMLVRSAHPPSISSLECFCLDHFFTQWYDCINKKTNPPPNSCGSQEQGPFFCLDFVLSHNPERCTNQSCVKEKALVLISILSGLCISWKIYLPARLSGRCAVYFPLKNGKPNISSWTEPPPPPPTTTTTASLFCYFCFCFFLARGFSAFQTYTKEALGRKLFSIKCRQAENANFRRGFFNERLQFSVKGIFILLPTTQKCHILGLVAHPSLQHCNWRLVGY